MTNSVISEKIKCYIMEMPSLSVSVGKALQICGNQDVNPIDLNHVISLDPVLTGKLIKLINSAYYGLSTHVTSLVRAITMLGLNTVKNLVLAAAALSTLPKNKIVDGLNMEGFWHHSLCVAVTSKLLAKKQGIEPRYLEEYFSAGLLHDIGKIPLNAVLAADYMQMVTTADRERKPLYLVENGIADFDHCRAGEMIAHLWKLDDSIKDVILHHHKPCDYSGCSSNIVNTIAAANYFSLVYEVGFAGDRKPEKPDQKVWDSLGVDEDFFLEIMENLYKEIEKARVFLQN